MNTREKVQRWTDCGYIACLAVFLAYRAFFNTMIHHEFGIKRCKPAEYCWLAFMMLLIVVRVLYLRCYSKIELLIAVSFCIIVFLSWRHARIYWLLMVPLLMVGAKGIPFDRIVKTFLISVGAVIGLAMFLSLVGVIPNLEYVRNVADPSDPANKIQVPRYAFGTTYPTTFSEFVFFLSAAWLFLRRKAVKIYDVVLFSVISIFLYKVANAWTGAVCDAALAMISLLMIILRYAPEKVGERVHKLCAPLIGVTGVCAAVMTVLMIIYDRENLTWNKWNKVFHYRLGLGHIGWKYYGGYLFGIKVKYHTTGANPDLVGRPDYFNLDCSYHMILVNYGTILFLCVIAIFTLYALRAWQKKDLALLLILVLISLECVMENRMFQPQYDIFLLMLFANMQSVTGEKYLMSGRSTEKPYPQENSA